jgi:N-acetylglucosamine-6-phosphate deacetylase
MPATLLTSVQLILADEILKNAWIRFDGGTILDFGTGAAPDGSEATNGAGLFLAPGFVDTHVHGGGGADFLDATPEAFHTITKYHLSQGTTAISPTLATTTYARMQAVLDVWSTVRDQVKARLLPVHLEGPHLAATKAGAQDPKLFSAATDENIGWLVENAARISQMTVAPELPNALKLIERTTRAGIVMSAGHSEAREQAVCAGMNAGLSKVTHLFNAMTYAAKNGLFREAGLAEYALAEERLGCELIADGFHAAPTFMKLAIRSKGPEKIALISDALAGTGLPVGTTFMLGSLRCRVAEGVCTLADGSALAGSATTLMDQVRVLHRRLDVPLAQAVRMASLTPASLVGVSDRYGSIARGKAADFVQFDDELRIKAVWVNGVRV